MFTKDIITQLNNTRRSLKRELNELNSRVMPEAERAEWTQDLEAQIEGIGEAIEIIKQSAQLTACLRALQSYQEASANA